MHPSKVRTIVTVLVLMLLTGVFGFSLGQNQVHVAWRNYTPLIQVENKTPPQGVNVDLSLFWDVWERLSKNYADKKALDTQKMLYGAISGMVGSLQDPYTVFLPPEQNKEVKQELAGQFEGIGAQLGVKNKRIVVIAPLPDSPAQKAGIRSGDFIAKVDGQDTSNWSLPEAVSKIRGPKGTTVKLTIVGESEDPKEMAIVRSTIRIKSVEGWVRKWKMDPSADGGKWQMVNENESCDTCPRVAYLKLSQFGDETNNEWLITVNNLVSKMKQDPKPKGLIFDLRNNSGGYLNGAVFVASEFMKEGTVVIQEKGDGQRQSFSVSRRGLFTETPIIVLMNKGSASASEIVAGALKDNRRAKLLGENSFGKGSIQEAQDLGGGAGLHITVAKWLTPNGTWVNGKGLEPDVKVSQDEGDLTRDVQLEKGVEALVR